MKTHEEKREKAREYDQQYRSKKNHKGYIRRAYWVKKEMVDKLPKVISFINNSKPDGDVIASFSNQIMELSSS